MVISWIIFLGFILLFTALIVRTAIIRKRYRSTREPLPEGEVTQAGINCAEHLSQAVRFASVAGSDEPFTALLAFLKKTYPLVHAAALPLPADTYALVFRIEGSDETLEPALLCAHLDVVPAKEEGWEHLPFSGDIADGFIWGRGSFDDKGSAIAILESCEHLLSEKKQPRRTWYIALGSDEEVRGDKGAAFISSHFASEGLAFAFVLDEGGAVAQGFIPQVKQDIGVIGLSEKASLRANLTVEAAGGHSSTPSQPTSVGILAKAVSRIEHRGLKGKITYPVKKMLDALALHSSFPFALITGNSRLFKPLILKAFSSSATMNALVRSTATVTMLEGAQASNIVPTKAQAVVNIRALPGEDGETIVEELRKIIADDRVQIALSRDSQPSTVSPSEGEGYELIVKTLEQVFPSAVAVPYLMSGASDALHYEKVSHHVYRFSPFVMNKEELARMHSENERLSVENLNRAVTFYTQLIRNDS